MAKKHKPWWTIAGLDGPPPEVRGMHEYGVVWTADQPRPSWWENVRTSWRWGTWSYRYWGKKVRGDLRFALKHGWHATNDSLGRVKSEPSAKVK